MDPGFNPKIVSVEEEKEVPAASAVEIFLNWSIPQTPEQTEPMTDLPRNTHVIVNVKLLPDKPFLINYTICPWNEKTIDIPAFN